MTNHWEELIGVSETSKNSKKRVLEPSCIKPSVKASLDHDTIEGKKKKQKSVTFGKDVSLESNNSKKLVHLPNQSSIVDKPTAVILGPGDNNHAVEHRFIPPTASSLNLPRGEVGKDGITHMSINDAKILAEGMRTLQSSTLVSEIEQVDHEIGDDDGIKDLESIERHLNNLKYKLTKDIKRAAWVETLAITVNRFVQEKDKIEVADDFRRESAFLEISTLGVKECLRRLHTINVPFTRPDDFYAEMLKTDHQMYKVRIKLADEQARIKTVEARKKQRIEKKFAKSVQAERVKQKQQEKNKNLKKIEEWKKNKYQTAL